MRNIECKDLFKQWRDTIVDTSLFIAKWAVWFGKFVWGEIGRFFIGSTWITAVIIGFLIVGISVNHDNKVLYEKEIVAYRELIDSLEVVNKTDILLIKAGEYHITPHNGSKQITKDSVASLLSQLEAWYPDIIMAQIQTESGYGTSNVAAKANNILGMKKTTKRKTTQIKNQEYNGYGVYNNWESCVIDRVMWDYEVFGNKKPTREEYVEKLNNLYAESKTYGSSMNEYGKAYVKYL